MKKLFVILLFISMKSFAQHYQAEIRGDTVYRVIACESPVLAAQLLGGVWKETYMNDSTKNYAGKGYSYNSLRKNFVGKKPWIKTTDGKMIQDSVKLDKNCRWVEYVPRPADTGNWLWDRRNHKWVK